MTKATFEVDWDDLDYESWAAKCGLTVLALEPQGRGEPFHLIVRGSHEAIETLERDLSYGPVLVEDEHD